MTARPGRWRAEGAVSIRLGGQAYHDRWDYNGDAVRLWVGDLDSCSDCSGHQSVHDRALFLLRERVRLLQRGETGAFAIF